MIQLYKDKKYWYYYNIDKPQKCDAKCKKSDTNGHILCLHPYKIFRIDKSIKTEKQQISS